MHKFILWILMNRYVKSSIKLFCFLLFKTNPAEQVTRRQEIFTDLNEETLRLIGTIMEEINPYAQVYKHASEVAQVRQDVALVIRSDLGPDRRRYNAPTADQVAVIIPDNQNVSHPRDIVLRMRQGPLQQISELHPSYVPLQYPLIFPRGESGWFGGMRNEANEKISLGKWAAFMLQIREQRRGNSLLHLSGRLFQQFAVDMYAAIEQQRLLYCKLNQTRLRADSYSNIATMIDEDAMGNVTMANIGRKVILPSSFTGGPRYMNQKYQDAMAIVREYGKPDLFVTITCNPKWPEIQEALAAEGFGLTADDRPDIACRVFNEKLKQIKADIVKLGLFGRVAAHIHVIEFQKRGLPHCHMLIILDPRDKLQGVEDYDKVVSAEIPNPQTQPALHACVVKHMIHGPCGTLNDRSSCMENGNY